MKKTALVLLTIVALPSIYIFLDYVRFMMQPINDIKNVLIICQNAEPGSLASTIIQDIKKNAQDNKKISISSVDVENINLPFIKGDDAPAQKPLTDQNVQKWSNLIKEADALIFLVPNYNNGYSAALKNSIDVLWKEWHNKPTAQIGYSTRIQEGSPMMNSFAIILPKIKSDPIATNLYIYSHLDDKDSQVAGMLQELYSATQKRNYFKQLYRSVTDRVLVSIIKFFKKKNKLQ